MTIKAYEDSLMQYSDYIAHKQILLVVSPILLVIGTLGNVFSFFILMNNAKKASTYSYLSVLALMDLIVLYIGLFRHWLGLFVLNIEDMNNVLCKIVKFLGYFSSDTSVWLIVAVTIERTIVVMVPLKAPRFCNARNARITIATIITFFFLVNFHFLWSVKLQELSYNETIISKCQAKPQYSYLVENIWPWVDAGIYSFVPFSVIIILNGFIIQNVISAKKARAILRQHSSFSSTGSKQRSQGEMSKKITFMLLAVSIAFLVTTLPMVIVLIYTSFAEDAGDDYSLTKRMLIETIAEMLMYTNHSINFFLYCATGKKFRNQFKSLICCCSKKNFRRQSTVNFTESYRLCKVNETDMHRIHVQKEDDGVQL
ncbi:probable G-protein coupled receptor 139 [Ruditapes philippinarum]|uniref:probable G-protein coupled receptor 139 n=1 Tax=Ruditapes philippinarum TaxID=129788 RepID=UPI00295AEE03|nr:probable G-protein coupled receptor 139 [Ruditapes philippinarum]